MGQSGLGRKPDEFAGRQGQAQLIAISLVHIYDHLVFPHHQEAIIQVGQDGVVKPDNRLNVLHRTRIDEFCFGQDSESGPTITISSCATGTLVLESLPRNSRKPWSARTRQGLCPRGTCLGATSRSPVVSAKQAIGPRSSCEPTAQSPQRLFPFSPSSPVSLSKKQLLQG